jgi:tripartite-type tricarboxylate transporter receptor subunit TctC
MKVFAIVALSLLTANAAAAQTWPDKPIRLLVGFAAGGPTDIAARVVGDRLSEVLGKPVIVENVTGAAGNVATERVAKAAPDGYTLLAAASATIVTNPSLYARLNFDPVKDFAPITQIVTTPNLLVVPNDLPVNSVAELVAYAKAQSKLTFGSAGVGTSQHLAGELFKTMAGIDLQHVPYRGISATVPDLLAGRLTMVFGNISAMQPLVREGKARALAVTSPRRWPSVPGADRHARRVRRRHRGRDAAMGEGDPGCRHQGRGVGDAKNVNPCRRQPASPQPPPRLKPSGREPRATIKLARHTGASTHDHRFPGPCL